MQNSKPADKFTRSYTRNPQNNVVTCFGPEIRNPEHLLYGFLYKTRLGTHNI